MNSKLVILRGLVIVVSKDKLAHLTMEPNSRSG